MLKCTNCGSLVRDDITQCGMCGNAHFVRFDQIPQAGVPGVRSPPRGRGKALALLSVGAGILGLGLLFTLEPLDPGLTAIGFNMMIVGALIVLAITGVFSSMPYRSRISNRAEREKKRRESRKMAD